MEITFTEKDGITIVNLNGDLDSSTADQAREEITNKINDNANMIINMENCKYVSSAGLRVLMIVAKKLKAIQGLGVLACMVQEVEDVMEMTGFGHMLQSFSTIDEAISYLKNKGGN